MIQSAIVGTPREPMVAAERPLFLIPHRLLGNIYVRELGRAYQELGANVVYGPENLFESAARFDVIHLQWPEEQYRSYGSGPVEERAASFLHKLDEHKRRGAKLIWTVHNISPHEQLESRIDRTVYQEVIERSELIVHHCPASIDLLSAAYRIPSSVPAIVAPHGNYGGYPNEISREKARERLGVAQDAIVYLHFGAIRGYKGLDTLFQAYRRIRVKGKLLIVAGHYTGAGGLKGKLETLKLRLIDWFDRTTQLHLKMIEDRDVQVYLRAADAVVLSHSRGLNSGVAVLGMTFGRVVIGPDIGCIGHVLRQGENLIYAVNDAMALAGAMERVPTLDRGEVERSNIKAAAAWDWGLIAGAILDAAEKHGLIRGWRRS
jgi:glycosyltransferase involved in cell wall biosynthesis